MKTTGKHKIDFKKRIEDSYKLFDDIKELFEDPSKRKYLTSTLTLDEMNSLLEEFLICFTENEDVDKVLTVGIWKNIVSSQTFD
jgi:hypothetical protein